VYSKEGCNYEITSSRVLKDQNLQIMEMVLQNLVSSEI
jgi:hypothetical protein